MIKRIMSFALIIKSATASGLNTKQRMIMDFAKFV
jgi:hypothetical protein